MLGWFSAEIARASRRSRSVALGSPAYRSVMSFRAMRRPRFMSSASYISPVPPLPIFSYAEVGDLAMAHGAHPLAWAEFSPFPQAKQTAGSRPLKYRLRFRERSFAGRSSVRDQTPAATFSKNTLEVDAALMRCTTTSVATYMTGMAADSNLTVIVVMHRPNLLHSSPHVPST